MCYPLLWYFASCQNSPSHCDISHGFSHSYATNCCGVLLPLRCDGQDLPFAIGSIALLSFLLSLSSFSSLSFRLLFLRFGGQLPLRCFFPLLLLARFELLDIPFTYHHLVVHLDWLSHSHFLAAGLILFPLKDLYSMSEPWGRSIFGVNA